MLSQETKLLDASAANDNPQHSAIRKDIRNMHDRQLFRPGKQSPSSLLFTGKDSNLVAEYLGTINSDSEMVKIISWVFNGPDYSIEGFFSDLYNQLAKYGSTNEELEDLQATAYQAGNKNKPQELLQLLENVSRKSYLKIVVPHFELLPTEASKFIQDILQSDLPNIMVLLAIDNITSEQHEIEVVRKLHYQYTPDVALPETAQVHVETAFAGFSADVIKGQIKVTAIPDAQSISSYQKLLLSIIAQISPFAMTEEWLIDFFSRGGVTYQVDGKEISIAASEKTTYLNSLESEGIISKNNGSYTICHPKLNREFKLAAKQIHAVAAGKSELLPTFLAEHLIITTLPFNSQAASNVQPRANETEWLADNYPVYTQLLLNKSNVTTNEAAFLEKKIDAWSAIGAYEDIHSAIDLLLKYYEDELSKVQDKTINLKLIELWKTKLDHVSDAIFKQVTQNALIFAKTQIFKACPKYLQIDFYAKLFHIYCTQSDVDSGSELIQLVSEISPSGLKPKLTAGKADLLLSTSSNLCTNLAKRTTELHDDTAEACKHRTNENKTNHVVSYLNKKIDEHCARGYLQQYQNAVFFMVVNKLKLIHFFHAKYQNNASDYQNIFEEIERKIDVFFAENINNLLKAFAAVEFYKQVLPISYLAGEKRFLCFEIVRILIHYLHDKGIYCSTLLAALSMLLMSERGGFSRENTDPLYYGIKKYKDEFPNDPFFHLLRLPSHTRFEEINPDYMAEYYRVIQQGMEQKNYTTAIYGGLACLFSVEFAYADDLLLRTEKKRKLIQKVIKFSINLPAFFPHALALLPCFRQEQALNDFEDAPIISTAAIDQVFHRHIAGKSKEQLIETISVILTDGQLQKFEECYSTGDFSKLDGYAKVEIILHLMGNRLGVAEALRNKMAAYDIQGKIDDAVEVAKLFIQHDYINDLRGRLGEAIVIKAIARIMAKTFSSMDELPVEVRDFLVPSKGSAAFSRMVNAMFRAKILPLPAKEKSGVVTKSAPQAHIITTETVVAIRALQQKQQKIEKETNRLSILARKQAVNSTATTDSDGNSKESEALIDDRVPNGLGLADTLMLLGDLKRNHASKLEEQAGTISNPIKKQKILQEAENEKEQAEDLSKRAYGLYNKYNAPRMGQRIQRLYPSFGSTFGNQVNSIINYVNKGVGFADDIKLSDEIRVALSNLARGYKAFHIETVAAKSDHVSPKINGELLKNENNFLEPHAKAISTATAGYLKASLVQLTGNEDNQSTIIGKKVFLETALQLIFATMLAELNKKWGIFSDHNQQQILIIEKPTGSDGNVHILTNDLLNISSIIPLSIPRSDIPQIATSIHGYDIAVYANPQFLFARDPHYNLLRNDNTEKTIVVLSVGEYSIIIKSQEELTTQTNTVDARNVFNSAIFGVLQILLKDSTDLARRTLETRSTHSNTSNDSSSYAGSSTLVRRFKLNQNDVMTKALEAFSFLTSLTGEAKLFEQTSETLQNALRAVRPICVTFPDTWAKVEAPFTINELERHIKVSLEGKHSKVNQQINLIGILKILSILAKEKLFRISDKKGLPNSILTILTDQGQELDLELSLIVELHYMIVNLTKNEPTAEAFDKAISEGVAHTLFGQYACQPMHSRESIMYYLAVAYCVFSYEHKLCDDQTLIKYFDIIIGKFIAHVDNTVVAINIDGRLKTAIVDAKKDIKNHPDNNEKLKMLYNKLVEAQGQMKNLLYTSTYQNYFNNHKPDSREASISSNRSSNEVVERQKKQKVVSAVTRVSSTGAY